MQPHSMCAVFVAGYIWNRPEYVSFHKAVISIEYYSVRKGGYRTNVYEVEMVDRNLDDTLFRLYIIRGGGGISCTITVRRSGSQEGSEFAITDHSQHHLSGLSESWTAYKGEVRNGTNRNSLIYGGFEANFTDLYRREVMRFTANVRDPYDRDKFHQQTYTISFRSLQLNK